jgi:uncharacterized protein
MKHLLTLFFLFFLTQAFADSSLKTIQRKDYHPNGSIKNVKNYQKKTLDKWTPQGLEEHYYSNGKIKSRGRILNGTPVGLWSLYSKNGNESKGYFINGKKTGPWTTLNSDGVTLKIENYLQGRYSGTVEQNFTNGKNALKAFYKKGKLQGVLKKWHPNGRLAFFSHWNEGKEEGEFQSWSSSGILLLNQKFTLGQPTGTWSYYDLQGTLIKEVTFKNGTGIVYEYDYTSSKTNSPLLKKETPFYKGRIHGSQITYFSNGGVYLTQEYLYGKQQGEYSEYYLSGLLKVSGVFDGNTPSGKWKFFKEKESSTYLIALQEYKDNEKSFKTIYNEQGKEIEEIEYFRDKKDGSYRSLYSEGSLKEIGEYHLNKKNGLWRTFYSNGSLKSRKNYIDNKIHGPVQEWYLTNEGQQEITKIKGSYTLGEKNGSWNTFSKEGELQYKHNYQYGILHGVYEEYWPIKNPGEKPIQKVIGSYVKGKKDGQWTKFFSNGLPSAEGVYYYGLENGLFTEWFNYLIEGKEVAKFQGSYKLGEKDGNWAFYYRNGNSKQVENYTKGLLHGPFHTYYEIGTIKSKTEFVHSIIEGEQVHYYPNGKLKSSQLYVDGLKHGVYRENHRNGEVATIGDYFKGVPEGKWLWFGSNDSKKPTIESILNKGSGLLYKIYSNGKVKQKTPLLNGVPQGEELRFYRNGDQRSSAQFDQGMLHGYYKEYHDNGTLIEESEWTFGQPNGAHRSWYGNKMPKEHYMYLFSLLNEKALDWYENGELKSQGYWDHGVKKGTWQWFDRSGKETLSEVYIEGLPSSKEIKSINES